MSRLGQVTTMAALNKNYKLKNSQLIAEFLNFCFSNLKFIEGRKSNFFIKDVHSAAPWILLPEATSFVPPPSVRPCMYTRTRSMSHRLLCTVYVILSYFIPVTTRQLRVEAWGLASSVGSAETIGAGLKVERLTLAATEALVLSLATVTAAKACRTRYRSGTRLNSEAESRAQPTRVKTKSRLGFFFRFTVCMITAALWLRRCCFDRVCDTVGKHNRIVATHCNKNKGQICQFVIVKWCVSPVSCLSIKIYQTLYILFFSLIHSTKIMVFSRFQVQNNSEP